MTLSRTSTGLIILGISPLLGGCVLPLASQPVMSATWLFLLGGFFGIVYLANIVSQNRFLVIGTTFISSLIVSCLIATLIVFGLSSLDLDSNYKAEASREEKNFFRRIRVMMLPSAKDLVVDTLAASFLFVLAIVLGVVLSLALAFATPVFPRLPMYVMFLSIFPLAASFFFWEIFKAKDDYVFFLLSSLSMWIFGIICSGSLIVVGYIEPQILLSIGFLIVGVGILANLAARALVVAAIEAKIAIYATSFILMYELWIVVQKILLVWDGASFKP